MATASMTNTAEILPELLERRILILDGAMGTMIQGHAPDEATYRGDRFADHASDVGGNNELLSITQPEMIRNIHADFLKAGADIVCTNTFGANRISQADYAMEDLAYEMNVESVKVARAAIERPQRLRSLALVAPTGFNGETPREGAWGSTRGMPRLYRVLTWPPWRRALFDALTSRPSVRFFLRKTWGGKGIDEQLFEYSWRTAREPNAEHAPYSFLSGYLFSADIDRVYAALGQPVWMTHGVRGDFVDYRRKSAYVDRPNWRIEAFDTGALPHFERTAEFTGGLDAFHERVARGAPAHPPGRQH